MGGSGLSLLVFFVRTLGLCAFGLITFIGLASGTSRALDFDLIDTENDHVAVFLSAYPILEVTGDKANLNYFPDETCGAGAKKSGNCEMFEFSCRADNPSRYDLLFWGLNIGHANFSGSILSGYELPHVIYFDRLVERHRNNLLNAPATDPGKSKAIVNFYFKSAERLPEKGDTAYLLQWDTQSERDADELSEMLSSGETLLAPYPVRLRRLVYNKLHPRAKIGESDLASGFVNACQEIWVR